MGLVASASRTRIDPIGSLETSALTKVQAACNFVNAEITRLRHQTIAIWAICVVGALLLWVVTGLGNPRVALVITAGIAVLAFVRARAELASSYRNVAARRIVAGLGNGLAYSPSSSLTRQQFAAMDLFPERCQRWNSRDEIVGRTRGMKYALHQVWAGRKDRRGAIFEGTIIKIDFGETVPGHTVVIPDRDGRALSADAGGPAPRRKKDLVMLKNPAFERHFDVYSTDYYEARKLVTPKFMQVLLDAHARLDTELRLCFIGKSLFISIAGRALRFETTLFADPLTPQAAVGQLLPLVSLAVVMAEARS